MSERKFTPYLAYKDSGIEWLGEIPAHWETKALKRIGGLQAGAGFPDDEQSVVTEEIPFFKVGDMGSTGNERQMLVWQHTVSKATARRLRAFVFPPGTIVFAKVGAALMLNRRRFLTRPSCIDNNMMGFMPGDCDPTWAMYWLCGLDMGELANPGAVPSVNEGQMRNTPAVVPPEPEQRAIAAFLDRETARIDALAAKKERVIELLKEKRTALITRAVTKGLDPNVPMKDSGIEWLGKIPAHWEVAVLKRRAQRIQTGTTPSTVAARYYERGVVAWYGPGSFADALPLQDPIKFISDSAVHDGVARVFEAGSSVIVTIGATIGKVAYMEQPGSCNQQITAVTFDRRVFPKFGAYQLKRLEPVLRGIAPNTTLPIIDQEDVGYLPFAVPPTFEQEAIATFLDRETARIDAMVAKVRDAIDRLKELRTALISAAVTGKLNVREEVK